MELGQHSIPVNISRLIIQRPQTNIGDFHAIIFHDPVHYHVHARCRATRGPELPVHHPLFLLAPLHLRMHLRRHIHRSMVRRRILAVQHAGLGDAEPARAGREEHLPGRDMAAEEVDEAGGEAVG